MSHSIEKMIDTRSDAEKKSLFDLVTVGLSVYSRYPTHLTSEQFRKQVHSLYPDIGLLFFVIYEKKIWTWKSISTRHRKYKESTGEVFVRSNAPEFIQTRLGYQVNHEETPTVGVQINKQGKIYKRFLNTDLQKMLG